jgi:hypothetical protein
MTYLLSLLDKAPVEAGATAADALAAAVKLAIAVEEFGYHRFWVAEHHSMTNLASSAPEALIAYLLARTCSIRIGSGGVMLQHYSASPRLLTSCPRLRRAPILSISRHADFKWSCLDFQSVIALVSNSHQGMKLWRCTQGSLSNALPTPCQTRESY